MKKLSDLIIAQSADTVEIFSFNKLDLILKKECLHYCIFDNIIAVIDKNFYITLYKYYYYGNSSCNISNTIISNTTNNSLININNENLEKVFGEFQTVKFKRFQLSKNYFICLTFSDELVFYNFSGDKIYSMENVKDFKIFSNYNNISNCNNNISSNNILGVLSNRKLSIFEDFDNPKFLDNPEFLLDNPKIYQKVRDFDFNKNFTVLILYDDILKKYILKILYKNNINNTTTNNNSDTNTTNTNNIYNYTVPLENFIDFECYFHEHSVIILLIESYSAGGYYGNKNMYSFNFNKETMKIERKNEIKINTETNINTNTKSSSTNTKRKIKINYKTINSITVLKTGFAICHGNQPAMIQLLNQNLDHIHNYSTPEPKNRLFFNLQETVCINAGLDSLNGSICVYKKNTVNNNIISSSNKYNNSNTNNTVNENVIAKFGRLGASVIDWFSNGNFFLVAITNKMKVDNGLKYLTCTVGEYLTKGTMSW